MPLSQEAIQTILGIKERVDLLPEQMAKNLKITFFPYGEKKVSKNVLSFNKELENVLVDLGVEVIPYERTLIDIPFWQKIKIKTFCFSTKIEKYFKRGFWPI